MANSLQDLIEQARRGGLTKEEQSLKEQWQKAGTPVLKRLEVELSGVNLTSLALVHNIVIAALRENNLSEVLVLEESPASATDAYTVETVVLGNPTEKASFNVYIRIEEGNLKIFISKGN